jgi:outer membrane protein assembly factor BamB
MIRSFPSGRRGLLALAGAGIVIAAAAGGGLAANGGRSSTSRDVAATWSLPNATLRNTRAVHSSIDSGNVSRLSVAWRLPLRHAGLFGYYANTPVFGVDGTIYFQDLNYNVFAVNSATGKTLWTHRAPRRVPEAGGFPMPLGEGPNGVVLDNGALYGETPSRVFSLDAATGRVLWQTRNLVEKKGQGFNIAPEVNDGRVYLSTSGQLHGGVAYALDAKTGKVLWRFQETKSPAQRTLGGTMGTGGAWNTPAIGPDGSVYFGIANPYRSINDAIKHPTKLLYNDSLIALTPHGKLKWYYQGVPNDFHDWDMQISPIYTRIAGRPAVLDSGKMGYVYAVDARTGKLLWKTPVGKHNGHDNDGLKALHHRFKPKVPYVYFPGIYGGVETNMAVAGGVVYVPVVDLSAKFADKKSTIAANESFAKGKGEIEALNLSTGKVLWDTKLPQMAFGDATVTNDLVITTTYDGRLMILSRATGAVVRRIQLPAGTNSPVVVNGKLLVAVASLPQGKGQKAQIVAYKLPS